MKKTVYVTFGLPASGKSTWAKELVKKSNGKIKRINKDDLRAMVDAGVWSKLNEKFILTVRNVVILEALKNGYSVVVDDCNLAAKHLEDIRALVGTLAQVVVQDFTYVDVHECIRRDRQRANYVGEEVIKDMYKRFIEKRFVSLTPAPARIPGLRDAMICDLDGTVALMNGRSPYDEAKADTDLVNEPVAAIVKRYADAGILILFCSGRDEGRGKVATETWLQKNGFVYQDLFMRPAGDMRKDSIVKEEIYDKYIKGKYNVLYVLDDRTQVVEMWRKLGLTCLQVAPGNF